MNQMDFIDGEAARAPFKDIRSTRPSAAEEKAQLVLILGRMLKTVPAHIGSSSVQATRLWANAHAQAMKVVKNSRASKHDLEMAISKMRHISEPA